MPVCPLPQPFGLVRASCSDAFSSREPVPASLENALAERFRDQANPEHRLLGLVQKLHLPVGILLQAAGNAADQIGANRRHFGPGRVAAFEFMGFVGGTGISAMADPEEIQRHFF